MHVMNRNWSARKQHLHLQNAAEIIDVCLLKAYEVDVMAHCKRLDDAAFCCSPLPPVGHI